jgi:hypothetical protein
MKILIACGGIMLIAFAAALLLGSCEPEPMVEVRIEFPSKKQDRHQQYWFLTMSRGYAI